MQDARRGVEAPRVGGKRAPVAEDRARRERRLERRERCLDRPSRASLGARREAPAINRRQRAILPTVEELARRIAARERDQVKLVARSASRTSPGAPAP